MDGRSQITIVIADDHPVFRKGLRDIISAEVHFVIVGEAATGNEVQMLVQKFLPDILLLDLNMPGMNGLEVAAGLQERKSLTKIIILTMHKEEAVFNKAMDCGVLGYVLKESAVQDIIESIIAVNNSEPYISPAISQYLLKRRAAEGSLLKENPELNNLSVQERKILKLISENKSSKEIAGLLAISVRTVENHRMNICNKLNLHGTNGLLMFALENKSYL